MTEILVDSNVILDVLTEDPQWFEWSAQMLTHYADQGDLVINPIIYAEISIGFNQSEELETALLENFFRRDPLPYAAAFLAGQSFLEYRRRGGSRRSPLPDFYIGAHAAVAAMPLLTRDVNRYRSYFPSISLITP
ncbi:type II toxin-antitoxin system VapC family toxin [Gloeocapsa sp. PCC 73106]|uniref:type II toxin-antitoxin system VapC family toxin n=1 Tax=Gloeocapsa sp. PCC 73106 TaxID=102232 RepID=UPI0002AC5090|nr:type II toxin-antitoxin system VapC family toxin [Gloeocapsa sp. PCC 73106]ELR96708.1 putative nucleic acid-binding protein [Gloeocapsa sp. PCC 73106]